MITKMFVLFTTQVIMILGTMFSITQDQSNENWYIVILTSVLGIMLLVVGYFLAQFISNVNKAKEVQDKRMSNAEKDIAVHKATVEGLAKSVSKDISDMGRKLNDNKELKGKIVEQMNRIEAKMK